MNDNNNGFRISDIKTHIRILLVDSIDEVSSVGSPKRVKAVRTDKLSFDVYILKV